LNGVPPVPAPPWLAALPPLPPLAPLPGSPLVLEGLSKPLPASSSSVEALQPAQADRPTITASAGGMKSLEDRRGMAGS
jgi:hypothetical protein